jgi:hypothetical protein
VLDVPIAMSMRVGRAAVFGKIVPTWATLIYLGWSGAVLGGEPPRPAVPSVPAAPMPMATNYAQFRTNRYAVWEYYDVDRFGRFRPTVVQSPYGSYYAIDGRCYPWTPTHPLEVQKKIID